MSNTLGIIFKLTCFGESHGKAIGGIVDGVPSGIELDLSKIQNELNRRRPGQSHITTQRKENDEVQFLSGIENNITTGAPIGFIIPNEDQRGKDYEHLQNAYRPSHADYTYEKKYGLRSIDGGGRASARATSAWVVGGAIAKQILEKNNISINAFVSRVGKIKFDYSDISKLDLSKTEDNIVRCPDELIAQQMIDHIETIKKHGDTVGGIVSCIVKGVKPGLGEPLFNKLHAALGQAMLSINAVKGFEFGSGFECANMLGSEHNDIFEKNTDGSIGTKTNYSGGIQGGISNGEPIYFNVAFKPVATIIKEQDTVDSDGNATTIKGKGRHDPCVVPRAVPIVEAMAALVLVDFLLLGKAAKV